MNTYILKKDLNQWIAKYFSEDIISIEDLIGVIEELGMEVDRLEEKLEDQDKYYNDNWKPIDDMTMYGLSERDFH